MNKLRNKRRMSLPYLADLHAMTTNDSADEFIRHF